LEAKWISSLRQYLGQAQMLLQFETKGIPPLEREHNVYLMEEIIRSNWFTDNEIMRLNYCRFYLNAVTLSDLTNTTGDSLDSGTLEGKISIMSSSLQYMEMNQSALPQSAWKLWKQANRLWSNSTSQLYQPLGYWIRDLRHRRIRHFAFKYCRKLYVKAQEGYMECTNKQEKRCT
jgi:hypothetical protein